MKTLNFLNSPAFDRAIVALDKVWNSCADISYQAMLIDVEDDNLCEIQETLEIAGLVDDSPRLNKTKEESAYWIDHNS